MQDAVDRQLVAVVLVDRMGDFGVAGQQGLDGDVFGQQTAQLVERDHIVDVRDGDGETVEYA